MNKTNTKYEVLLANVGNPDFGQKPNKPLPGTECGKWKAAVDFADASEICRAYIEANHLGGGNWSGGAIREVGKTKLVGRVSYNGRVWPPIEWTAKTEPLWEPA